MKLIQIIILCAVLILNFPRVTLHSVNAEGHGTGISKHQSVNNTIDVLVGKDADGKVPNKNSVRLKYAAKQLADLLSAARDIQEVLNSALQQHAQLLRDLKALQTGIVQKSRDAGETGMGGSDLPHPEGTCRNEEVAKEGKRRDGVRSKEASWASSFELLATVDAEAEVTALHAMHPSRVDGTALFAVAGNAKGVLKFFSMQGDIAATYDTGSAEAFSAIASLRVSRNESLVAVGLADGSVSLLRIHYSLSRPHRTAAEQGAIDKVTLDRQLCGAQEGETGDAKVTHLVFLAPPNTPYQLVVARSSGSVDLWRSKGTLRSRTNTGDQILLLKATPKGAAAITPRGIASIAFPKDQPFASPQDVHQAVVQRAGCQGLDDSTIISAAWAVNSHGAPQYDRFYALTGEGDLLVVFVSQAGAAHRCKVWYKKDLPGTPVIGQMEAIRGYVFLSSPDLIQVFKTNSSGVHAIITEPLQSLAQARAQDLPDQLFSPVLATSRYNLILVALGNGLIGVYKSRLPFREAVNMQTDLWKRPLFAIAMVFVGYWQFTRLKSRRASRAAALAHHELEEHLEFCSSAAREQGRVPDEDAEFAAEIRAAYGAEQRSGEAACTRGPEPGMGQVVHEGFGCARRSYGGSDMGSPPETGGPFWPGHGGNEKEGGGQYGGNEHDRWKEDHGAGAHASEDEGSAMLREQAIRVHTEELHARIASLCSAAQEEIVAAGHNHGWETGVKGQTKHMIEQIDNDD